MSEFLKTLLAFTLESERSPEWYQAVIETVAAMDETESQLSDARR